MQCPWAASIDYDEFATSVVLCSTNLFWLVPATLETLVLWVSSVLGPFGGGMQQF